MRVFISWSGERSHALARAFRDWLPNVIQAINPWMSDVDIDKGARWNTDIALQLSKAKVGLICLTPENLNAPWILFEAGALSKTLKNTYVCPYLFQVEPTDIKGPLVQFQSTKANKDDSKKLIHTINQALEDIKIPKEKLDEAFEVWWPKFEDYLNIIPDTEVKEPKRNERDIIEEILELVRGLTRDKKPGGYKSPYVCSVSPYGLGDTEQVIQTFFPPTTLGIGRYKKKKETPKEDEEQEEKK